MTAFKTIACGALLAASTICGPTFAQAVPNAATWQWSQTGDGNFDVVWSTAMDRPQHGGGVARLSGGGDSAEILYADTPMLMQAPAVVASLMGGGDDTSITYAAPDGSGQIVAGASATPGQPG